MKVPVHQLRRRISGKIRDQLLGAMEVCRFEWWTGAALAMGQLEKIDVERRELEFRCLRSLHASERCGCRPIDLFGGLEFTHRSTRDQALEERRPFPEVNFEHLD